MKKSILFLIVLFVGIFLISQVSADIIVSPAEPIINGNNYVFITYNDSAYADSPVLINITDPNSELKKECEVTLNEYGFGKCKYNFTSSDISGTWNYATNTSVSGTFQVGKVTMNIKDRNSLTSIKYGQKTTLEVNLSYENLMPKEILRTGISIDIGTYSNYHDFLDVDGDGDKDLVITTYDALFTILDSVSRYLEGAYRIAGIDFRTVDFETSYMASRARFGDADGDGVMTMFVANNSGVISAFKNINLSSGTSTTAAVSFSSADDGTYRGGIEVCDVNGDGLIDQVMGATYEGPYVLYNYTDTGGFVKIWVSPDYGSVNSDTYPVCADFDNDGYNEWVMTEYVTGNYFLDINHTGNLNVTMSVKGTDRSNTYLGGAAIDFDKDGKIEFISRETTGRLQILEFNKSGTNLFEEDLSWQADTDYTDFTYSSSYIQFDDLNKNGRPDFMITGNAEQPPVLFYEYNPDTNS